ncbi:hypothetical protein D3C72_2061470 [compost metagenome]
MLQGQVGRIAPVQGYSAFALNKPSHSHLVLHQQMLLGSLSYLVSLTVAVDQKVHIDKTD